MKLDKLVAVDHLNIVHKFYQNRFRGAKVTGGQKTRFGAISNFFYSSSSYSYSFFSDLFVPTRQKFTTGPIIMKFYPKVQTYGGKVP
jgi:hypothetical protein